MGVVVAEPVADVLARVAEINGRIGPSVVELLNNADAFEQAGQLRQLGQYVGSLSANCWPAPLRSTVGRSSHQNG